MWLWNKTALFKCCPSISPWAHLWGMFSVPIHISHKSLSWKHLSKGKKIFQVILNVPFKNNVLNTMQYSNTIFFSFAMENLVLHTWAIFGKTNVHVTFSDWYITSTVTDIFCFRRVDSLEAAYINVDHCDFSVNHTIWPRITGVM